MKINTFELIVGCLISFSCLFSGGAEAQVESGDPVDQAESKPDAVVANEAEPVMEITAFERELSVLQRKMSSASSSVVSPAGMPNDVRAFLGSASEEIDEVEAYYRQMIDVLSSLTPGNPYQESPSRAGDIQSAEAGLKRLTESAQDGMISRTLLSHIQAVRMGSNDDSARLAQISRESKLLEREIQSKEWNYENEFDPNALSGGTLGGAGQVFTAAELLNLKERYRALQVERSLLATVRSPIRRRVQFQLYILELSAQQRYIHALIACGFYRYLSSDTSFNPEQLEQERGQAEQMSLERSEAYTSALSGKVFGSTNSLPAIPNATALAPAFQPQARTFSELQGPQEALPTFNSITGLEAFLTTQINESKRKRGAFDGMVGEGQYGSAQALLIDLLLTAKHQPELHTIPYVDRQRILEVSTKMLHLSESLTSLDYEAIKQLADELESLDNTVTMTDVRAFADKYPIQARVWARQADVLLKSNKVPDAQKMIEAALKIAPLDSQVQESIENTQNDMLEMVDLLETLEEVVDDKDYREAHERMEEFMPLAESGDDPELRNEFSLLLDMEKDVQTSLEKSEAMENRGEYARAWLEVVDVSDEVSEDDRLVSRRNKLGTRCGEFAEGFYSAEDFEERGKDAIALSWYLNLLEEAPGSEFLVERVDLLSQRLNTF